MGLTNLSKWIIQPLKNVHEKLNKTESTLHYIIGNKISKPKLKPRLPQDIFLEAQKHHPDLLYYCN